MTKIERTKDAKVILWVPWSAVMATVGVALDRARSRARRGAYVGGETVTLLRAVGVTLLSAEVWKRYITCTYALVMC